MILFMGYSSTSLQLVAEENKKSLHFVAFYLSTLITSYGIFLGDSACQDQLYKIIGPFPYDIDQYAIPNDWYVTYEGYINLVKAIGNIVGAIWSMNLFYKYSS